MTEILRLKNLVKKFRSRHGGNDVFAVNDVTFSVERGETLGIVGESGCGKSTLGRCIMRLIEPTSGEVFFEGQNLRELTPRMMRAKRRDIQMIFQDPLASLDPRMNVGAIVREPMDVHGIGTREERRQKVSKLLDIVGLPQRSVDSYPHEFSGGQRQRIGIARALALNPKLIVADEPVSALDVSIQAQILNLLTDLKREFGLSYIFISHDLTVVEHMSDSVAVMYLGKIVEHARCTNLYSSPSHPYTKALMASVPRADPELSQELATLEGEPPNPESPPLGCPFHPRCPEVMERCLTTAPENHMISTSDGSHEARCHLFQTNGSNPKPP